jgi:hypothetical protein
MLPGRGIELLLPRCRMLLLLLVMLADAVVAIAPPHANFTKWESTVARRRRLGIHFSYQPQHVSVEYCRYLTEKQCRKQDEAVESAKRERRLISTGTIKVLVVLCRFTDHADRTLPTREYFDELFNGNGATSDANPIGSVRDWFLANSNGRYDGKLRSSRCET